MASFADRAAAAAAAAAAASSFYVHTKSSRWGSIIACGRRRGELDVEFTCYNELTEQA